MHEGRRAKTTRKKAAPEDRFALAQAAAQERKAKSQMLLLGGGAGGLLLLVVIVVAASSGGSRQVREERRKAAAPPPVEAPVEKPKPSNYVRNTGAIVFVCAGADAHPEKEVLIPLCPQCSAKNAFEVDSEAGGYRCSKCKALTSDVKCADCGKTPRVTKLKKMLATAR